MKSKTGNEPINPTYFKDGEMDVCGLTKREYFAGLAMQGLMANNNSCSITHIIEMSIKTADELLKQLDINNDNLLQEDNDMAQMAR